MTIVRIDTPQVKEICKDNSIKTYVTYICTSISRQYSARMYTIFILSISIYTALRRQVVEPQMNRAACEQLQIRLVMGLATSSSTFKLVYQTN